MNLENLQRELDRVKWLESEKTGKDMAGKMQYCFECVGRDIPNPTCNVSQELRTKNKLCAIAYTEMKKNF